ncbi:hypothetical protein QQ054_01405 [Oscillatoria amoena NRMC-F 0135]|nr:hypothetical protein [Geitlerinema splendidum]MDL5044705.1 hypothetical protein [Oscillatoria amoena NRMC-F 0135]
MKFPIAIAKPVEVSTSIFTSLAEMGAIATEFALISIFGVKVIPPLKRLTLS